jgi:hypothetical protein
MIEELEIGTEFTKSGKPRKRKAKKKIEYFNLDTQAAILRYRSSKSQDERNKIYNQHLHYAFYKLAENIIHTFKFYYTEVDNIEDLKYEVISFLLQKIDLYDESKGKAYSYFGTIAKRYLIIYNQKNYKKLVNKIEVSNVDNDEYTVDSLIIYSGSEDIDRTMVLETFIEYVDYNLLELFERDDDIKVADAIMEIFKKRDQIDIFNKKAIFIYIKEMVDIESNSITRVIKRLKNIYKDILNDYIENKDL